MNDLGSKRLETDRLILRKFEKNDAEGIFLWASNPNVTRFVSWNAYRNIQEAELALLKWIKDYEKGSYHWCVQVKETGDIIGRISVVVHWKNHYCEVGFCYGEQYWHNGYATEALKGVINFLLFECEFHTIEAKSCSKNIASVNVMKRAGMIKEAVLKERCYDEVNNEYDDLLCFFINREQLNKGNNL